LFKNRGFLVKVVKDPDAIVDHSPPPNYREIAKLATKSVSTCIAVYVGADTIRRVIVYAISAKF
jgi:hypothetical protein